MHAKKDHNDFDKTYFTKARIQQLTQGHVLQANIVLKLLYRLWITLIRQRFGIIIDGDKSDEYGMFRVYELSLCKLLDLFGQFRAVGNENGQSCSDFLKTKRA